MVARQSSWNPTLRWHSQCQENFQLTEKHFWPLCLWQRPTTVVRQEDTHQRPRGSQQVLAGALQHSAESALISLLKRPESDPPTACKSFACKTLYHWGDQEGDPPDNLRQSIGKGWHPYWDLQGSGPRRPWGLPRCPAHYLGGGDDARRFPRHLDCLSLSIRIRKLVGLQELQGHFPLLSRWKDLCASHP